MLKNSAKSTTRYSREAQRRKKQNQGGNIL